MGDALVDRLNQHSASVRFCSASPEVIAGLDLAQTGNQFYGKNVYISTDGPPSLPPPELRCLGRRVTAGAIERFAACELRCWQSRGVLTVQLFDRAGQPLSIALRGRADADGGCDEGLLAWYGPVEDYCTPWSDNDPSQCQVVTVEGLRAFAQSYRRRRQRRGR